MAPWGSAGEDVLFAQCSPRPRSTALPVLRGRHGRRRPPVL